jgi:hydroxymethylpyrimidine kinase/phosphomethylpyrimidine kinase
MTQTHPISLTIAGSDSGGGAGIQADLKTFSAFRCFGTSVVTAITAQNTLGVSAVHAIPLDIVQAQLAAVFEDLPPASVKTGMLATAPLVRVVAEALRDSEAENYVLDPVMVATSGDRLLDQEAEQTLADSLLPLCVLVTPNLHEARILTGGHEVGTLEEMRAASRTLVQMGAGAALVKGGHMAGEAVDLLWDGKEEHVWRKPRIESRHTHGTGCTLSAAVAACLAHGMPLAAAAERAVRWVARAIETAPGLGRGHGPVNHFAPTA